jgi:hypothetical protein
VSPSTAASLPLPSERPDARRPIAIATATIAEPGAPAALDKIVTCGFCHVDGLASQMTGIGGGQYRCDIRRPDCDCVQRYLRWEQTGAKPAPILSSAELVAAVPPPPLEPLPKREPRPAADAEPVPALPPAQEAALTAFEDAHAEQDAAEAGQTRTEDEEPAQAVTEPPASDGDGAEPDAAPVLAEGSAPAGTPGEVG